MKHGTYAVWWQEDGGPRQAGKLQLEGRELLLTHNGSGTLALPLDEIVSVEYGSDELHIERRDRLDLRIGNLDGPGALLELSDALAT